MYQDSTAQYLEWLKGIKDFHGSVEKSSLSRAQVINSCGVYIVGNDQEQIASLENSLLVEIPAKDNSGKMISALHANVYNCKYIP